MNTKPTVKSLITGFAIILFALLASACGGGGGGGGDQPQQSTEDQSQDNSNTGPQAATWDNFSWDDGSTWQ